MENHLAGSASPLPFCRAEQPRGKEARAAQPSLAGRWTAMQRAGPAAGFHPHALHPPLPAPQPATTHPPTNPATHKHQAPSTHLQRQARQGGGQLGAQRHPPPPLVLKVVQLVGDLLPSLAHIQLLCRQLAVRRIKYYKWASGGRMSGDPLSSSFRGGVPAPAGRTPPAPRPRGPTPPAPSAACLTPARGSRPARSQTGG